MSISTNSCNEPVGISDFGESIQHLSVCVLRHQMHDIKRATGAWNAIASTLAAGETIEVFAMTMMKQKRCRYTDWSRVRLHAGTACPQQTRYGLHRQTIIIGHAHVHPRPAHSSHLPLFRMRSDLCGESMCFLV